MTVIERIGAKGEVVKELLMKARRNGGLPRHPAMWNDFSNIGRPPGGPWNNWNQWSQFQNR
jgi:hypothetical protein